MEDLQCHLAQMICRRDLLKLGSFLALSPTGFMLGCGSQINTTTESSEVVQETPHIYPQMEVTLTFSESDDFYNKLEEAAESKAEIIVKFDGNQPIGRDSKMLEILRNVKNWESVIEKVRETGVDKEGRLLLSRLFDQELMETAEITNEEAAKSNNVFEPGTITLVVIILIASTAGGLAAYGLEKGYKVEFIMGLLYGSLGMKFTPQGSDILWHAFLIERRPIV